MTVTTLVSNAEFEIRGEFLWFGVILHGDVHTTWSKGVRLRVTKCISEIARTLSQPVYAFVHPSFGQKHVKFIQATGGREHHKRLTPDGDMVQMFIYPSLDLI
jgi:hypothetical protein